MEKKNNNTHPVADRVHPEKGKWIVQLLLPSGRYGSSMIYK